MSYLGHNDFEIKKFYVGKPEVMTTLSLCSWGGTARSQPPTALSLPESYSALSTRLPYVLDKCQGAVCDCGYVQKFLKNKVFSYLIIKVELKFQAIKRHLGSNKPAFLCNGIFIHSDGSSPSGPSAVSSHIPPTAAQVHKQVSECGINGRSSIWLMLRVSCWLGLC